jgi:hypothetical protein
LIRQSRGHHPPNTKKCGFSKCFPVLVGRLLGPAFTRSTS